MSSAFTDDQGVVFTATHRTLNKDWEGHTEVIDLKASHPDWNKDSHIAFWAEDATKIIAILAEVASVKPTWDDVNAQLNSLLRVPAPADPDEPTEDMGA